MRRSAEQATRRAEGSCDGRVWQQTLKRVYATSSGRCLKRVGRFRASEILPVLEVFRSSSSQPALLAIA